MVQQSMLLLLHCFVWEYMTFKVLALAAAFSCLSTTRVWYNPIRNEFYSTEAQKVSNVL